MDPTDKFLREVEARKLPVHIDSLLQLFDRHLSRVDINSAFVEKFLNVREKRLQDNFNAVRRVLKQTPVSKLIEMKGAMGLCRATLRELHGSIDRYIRGEAVKFYPESSEEYRAIRFSEIVPHLIQDHLTELFTVKEIKGLLTKDLVTEVYVSSISDFEGLTQAQFFSVQRNSVEVLRALFFQKLEVKVNIFAIESVRKKALKLIGMMRIEYTCMHLEQDYDAELAGCQSDLPMDSDLDPASDKGNTMYTICYKAWSCQSEEMKDFAGECLERCIDWNRYPAPTGLYHPNHVLACIIRVFIGFINFRDFRDEKKDTLCCHPEVYLWMRRLLKTLYEKPESANYFERRLPKASSYLENRYLNALCRGVAERLKRIGRYRRPDENLLRPEERILPSDSSVLDEVVVRTLQLDTNLSLILQLHISGYTSEADDEKVSWSGTKELDVSRAVVCWKAGTSAINIMSIVEGSLLAASPLRKILSVGLFFAGVIKGLVFDSIDAFKSAQLNAKRTGQYLALLIIHKRLQNRFLSFVSFSLGTQVILSCLEELGHYNLNHPEEPVYVTDVVLILGAVNLKEVQWNLVSSVVKGRFINVFSRDDRVLGWFFNVISENPIGATEVMHDNVENCDVTRLCSDKLRWFKCQHLEARTLIKKIFKKLELDP